MRDSVIHVLRMLSMGANKQGHTCSVSLEDLDASHCSFLSSLLIWLSTQRVLNANSLIMTGITPKLSVAIFVTFIFHLAPFDLRKQVSI